MESRQVETAPIDVTSPSEGTLDFDEPTLRAIAEVYNIQGNEEYGKRDFHDAVYFYTKGINVKCKDDELNAKLYKNRALAYRYLGNATDSFNDAVVAVTLQPQFGEVFAGDSGFCVKYEELYAHLESKAEASCKFGHFNEAIHSLEFCAKIAEGFGDKTRGGIAYANLGNCHVNAGDLKRAIECFELCINHITGVDHELLKCYVHTCLGDAHYNLRNFTKAIDNYQVCLQILEKIGDVRKKINMYDILSKTYFKSGDYKNTIHFQELRLKSSKEIGDMAAERSGYYQLATAYYNGQNYERAIKFCELYLKERNSVERYEEGIVYSILGNACRKTRDFKRALAYQQRYLKIMNELGDKSGEGNAYSELGDVYQNLGGAIKSMECYKQHLHVAKENGDKPGKGRALGKIGFAHLRLGNFKAAVEYFELSLDIAKEIGSRFCEAIAVQGLGLAHDNLGHFTTAMEFFELQLQIAKDIGAKELEGSSYCNLGNTCRNLGNFKQALVHHTQLLNFVKESGDRRGEGVAYGSLGTDYYVIGFLREAIENHERQLAIVKEQGDKEEEGRLYGNLGNDYRSLGNLQKAKHYYELSLKIAKTVKSRAVQGGAYANLGIVYRQMEDFEKAIENHNRHLEISKEVGDRRAEGRAYGNLGLVFGDLGDLENALEYHRLCLEVAKEIGDKAGEGHAYGNIGSTYTRLGFIEKAQHYHECQRKMSMEVGDKIGEAIANFHLGTDFQSMGSLGEAVCWYRSGVSILNDLRKRLQSNDEWKIGLRDVYEAIYAGLWRVLINQNAIVEGLVAAEEGRAQALKDLMVSNYGVEMADGECLTQRGSIDDTISCISSNIVFTAIHRDLIVHWVCHKKNICLRKPSIKCNTQSLVKAAREKTGVTNDVRCEDRSLDRLRNNEGESARGVDRHSDVLQNQDNPLRTLYDLTISPISDLLHGDELIVVPDGPLWLAPYAAFMDSKSRYLSESFRIRIIPSLLNLKLILDCPATYHAKNGALLVGDPCVQTITNRYGKQLLPQLPSAKKEVEMIGQTLHTTPLTGKEATKHEVLKRLSDVALVHIAAHGRMETGEIALSPNRTRASQEPRDEDFLLSMSDVLNVRLRARLVVLSCCHSGRGEINAEGVVGIARAFLGAGARSVLVSLWAIDDEATLEFMKHFYQHLAKGESASKSLNQAMKIMRESDKFSEVKYWAPFVLIGDDVTLEFSGSH